MTAPVHPASEFPILESFGMGRATIRSIPWDVIAPHGQQAKINHMQTLQTLAERGGLSATEAVAVLEDREWYPMTLTDAERRLQELVEGRRGRPRQEPRP